jgi:hypothetical protein
MKWVFLFISKTREHTMSEEWILDDLEPQQVKVKIKDKHYHLREASADAAVKFRNATLKAAKMSDGKVVGMENLADAEPLLVSLCLYKAGKDEELVLAPDGNPDSRQLVPQQTIRGWPDRTQKVLFDKIKEMSPTLEGKETLESLDKKIELFTKARQELLESMKEKKVQEDTIDSSV